MSIVIRNVSKRFGSFLALDQVSLEVPSGSLLALLGPSGSGKTTLLRIIAGLEVADQGTILHHEEDITEYSARDRKVGFVFQHYALFRHMTIAENIAYGKPGVSLTEIRACARAAAIDDFIQSLPQGYDTIIGERGCTISAGERQRIALARALLRNPSVLILDEPTAALDAASEAAIVRTLSDTLRSRTVLLITHRISLVEIADLAVVLDAGRIIESGSPRELLTRDSPLARQFGLSHTSMAASL